MDGSWIRRSSLENNISKSFPYKIYKTVFIELLINYEYLMLNISLGCISIDIQAMGFVAEVFEDEYVHDKLVEALRKNNIHYKGYGEEDIPEPIKKKVESWAPKAKTSCICDEGT